MLARGVYLTAEFLGKTPSDLQEWMHIPLGYLNQVKIYQPLLPIIRLQHSPFDFSPRTDNAKTLQERSHVSVSSKAVNNFTLALLTQFKVIARVRPRIQVRLQEQVHLKSQEGTQLPQDCHSILQLPARHGNSITRLSSVQHSLGFLPSEFWSRERPLQGAFFKKNKKKDNMTKEVHC